jgi:hypothetical protein
MRAHHQVAEIARPHLLEKRNREAELAAEQDVPQDYRADQRAAGTRKEAVVLRNVALQKAPGDDLQRRPVDQLQKPRPRRHQEIPVAQHHRLDAMDGNPAMRGDLAHGVPSRTRPRATSRNTSSSVARL